MHFTEAKLHEGLYDSYIYAHVVFIMYMCFNYVYSIAFYVYSIAFYLYSFAFCMYSVAFYWYFAYKV